MDQLAQCRVVTLTAALFKKFNERVDFLLGERGGEQSLCQQIDNVSRFGAKISGYQRACIYRIAPDLLRDLRSASKTGIRTLSWLPKIR
jgi:hypothetical protein